MRKLLIACVLLLTGSAFYSALWFKSETIEADIRTRVTDDLAAKGAADIGIDVDGRHVTLSGIVNDEAVEAEYLDIASATFGALGPIDGLTFQPDLGTFTAIKTSDGIALRGTVSSEESRAALIAEAEAATGGSVDDQLVVSGTPAPWQDEVGFGVSLLAGLSAGTLTAAPDSFSVSGIAEDDPAGISAAVADRAGWQAFVSSPVAEQQLSGEVARLTAEVSDRDATVGTLETALADAEAQVATVTSERDGVRQELAALRANLTEDEANADNLRQQLADAQTELSAAEALLQERDQALAALTDEVSAAERRVTGADAMIAALSSNLTDGGSEVEALTGQIAALETEVATLEAEVDALGQEAEDYAAQIADRDATIEELNGELAAQTEAVGVAEAEVANLADQLGTLTETVAARDVTIEELNGELDARDAALGLAEAEIADLSDQVGTLTETVAGQDATIATLETQSRDESAAEVAALTAQVTTLEAQIESALDAGRSQVSILNDEISARDDIIADLKSTMDGSESQSGDMQAQVDALEASVGDLTQTIAARDATIATLQSRGVSNATVAEQCAARASAVMVGSQINFDTATTQVDQESVVLLERLTGIALACVGDSLMVEVGGHTDSFGTDEVNQELSEARAQAVVDFMIARGVPAGGLVAVGYGESQPVADNGSPEGRAENRRISFDWQAR